MWGPPAVFNPAVAGWLAMVSATVAAAIVTDLSKEGLDTTTDEWLTGYRELVRR